MIAVDAVRLGRPVEAAGRVLTPVLRVRYTVAGTAGAGSVAPLGVVSEGDGGAFFYAFDPLKGWDWVSGRLEG